jgi:hypothetical protein
MPSFGCSAIARLAEVAHGGSSLQREQSSTANVAFPLSTL